MPTSMVAPPVMSWEQKFEVLKGLSGTFFGATVNMRAPGDWYAGVNGVEIKSGGCLGTVTGNGRTPELAICDLWNKVINVEAPKCLVLNAFDPEKRRHVRWNGFMFQDVIVDG